MHIINRILVNNSIHPKLRFIRFPQKIRNLIYNYYSVNFPNFFNLPLSSTEEKNISNLKKNGFIFTDILSDDLVEKAKQKIDTIEHYKGQAGKILYKHHDIFRSGVLNEIYLNNKLLNIVEEYFGCAPKIQYLTAWKTLPGNETNEMFFHPDRHGHKFLKFFIYLNDVNEFDGHHEIIIGSQEENLEKILKNSSKELKKAMIEKSKKGWYKKIKLNNNLFIDSNLKIKKIFGKKGTTFMEDTSCFHRGTPVLPNHKERIIFQVLFTPWDNQKDFIDKISKPSWLDKYKDSPSANYAVSNLII